MRDIMLETGLPANVDAERLVLGSVMLGHLDMAALEAALHPDDFSLEKHRRIYAVMLTLHRRGDPVDRVTLMIELERAGQREAVDGWTVVTGTVPPCGPVRSVGRALICRPS